MRPSETQRITDAIRDYLDRHEVGDPTAGSLRRADIARACGIGKRHLSREDEPEFAALKQRIERLTTGSVPEPQRPDGRLRARVAIADVQERDPELSLDDVGRDIARRQAGTAFRLRQWLAYHETPGEVLDSPVMLADLDELIAGLRTVAEGLRPLIATVNRVRSAGRRDANVAG